MNIQIIYTNHRGKQIVKDFGDPMDVIGYIYRCWESARNAESTRRVRAQLDEKFRQERLAEQKNELLEE